jgi:hypothetical protein
MLADHLPVAAELLVAGATPLAGATSREVVKTDAVPGLHGLDLATGFFDDARYFVTQRQWQRRDTRNAGPIVRVRVADARRFHADEHVPGAGLGNRKIVEFQRLTGLG